MNENEEVKNNEQNIENNIWNITPEGNNTEPTQSPNNVPENVTPQTNDNISVETEQNTENNIWNISLEENNIEPTQSPNNINENLNDINNNSEQPKEEINKIVPQSITPQPNEGTPNNSSAVTEQPQQTQYEEVNIKEKEERIDSYFDGGLLELIAYHFLSGIITVITLGIGRPWAECMIMNYKVSHTVLNGKRLKFEGKGSAYFVQKFKWIFFTIITLGIYALWIPIKKLKWQTENTHFEDEPLIKGESYFDGKLIQLIGINLLSSLIITVSFGILYPFTTCIKEKWIAKHTIINKKRIIFTGRALSLFLHHLLWAFLTIITFGIFGLWLGIKYKKWVVKNTHIKLKDEEQKTSQTDIIVSIAIICVTFIAGAILIGFLLPKLKERRFNPMLLNPLSWIYNKQEKTIRKVRDYDDYNYEYNYNNHSSNYYN